MRHLKKYWLAMVLLLSLCNISQSAYSSDKKSEIEAQKKINLKDNYGESSEINSSPEETEWNGSDVLVYSGEVQNGGSPRRIDMKQGPDGRMYIAVSERSNSTHNGYIRLYESTNGGYTWTYARGMFTDWYISSISMIVESKDYSKPDSTRFLVYFTSGTNSSFDDATIRCYTARFSGGSYEIYNVEEPVPGNRYEYVSTCTNAEYENDDELTEMHVVARYETNSESGLSIRHFRSTSWGFTHTSTSGAGDFIDPMCAYVRPGIDGKEIYVTFQRKINSTTSDILLLLMDEIPSTSYTLKGVTGVSAGILFEKPCITSVQNSTSDDKEIVISCLKDKKPIYLLSSNGGEDWSDYTLSSDDATNTWCASYKNGNYLIAYTNATGSIVSLRKNIFGSLFWINYIGVNSTTASKAIVPVCVFKHVLGTNIASVAYAGGGDTHDNVYFDAYEVLTNVEPVSSAIPDKFELYQNYPNPFNPTTKIKFSIPLGSNVKLSVYDLLGREVRTLINENLHAGTYEANFDGKEFSTGTYFYKIVTENFTEIKKMTLIK